MKAYTKEQIETLEHSGAPMPPNFSGKWKGRYFWRGRRWLGPAHLMGCSKLKVIETEEGLDLA